MNEVPDFEKLQAEFAKLKQHGYNLQAKGIEIVKIAESGANNVATYSSVFSISVPIAKNDKVLQQKLDVLAESGRYTSQAVSKTNEYLGKANDQLAAVGMETLTGVTFSNFAALDIISYAATIAPSEQKTLWMIYQGRAYRDPSVTKTWTFCSGAFEITCQTAGREHGTRFIQHRQTRSRKRHTQCERFCGRLSPRKRQMMR